MHLARLTGEQRALLVRLPDRGDGERIAGATIKSADQLVRRGLARCLGRERTSQAARYLRTPTGASEAAIDHEAPRVRRLLDRLHKATRQSFEEMQLVRAVFGHAGRPGIGLDQAVVCLRARGFTSTMSAARAVHLLTDQEVAP